MNFPKEKYHYGKWDLSEIGLGTQFGHLILDEIPFKLKVFVEIGKEQLAINRNFFAQEIDSNSINEIKGITNNKYIHILNPYIQNSTFFLTDNMSLEILVSDFIIGVHLDSLDESFIKMIDLDIYNLNNWSNNNIIKTSVDNEEYSISFSRKSHTLGSYKLGKQTLTFKDYVKFSSGNKTNISKEFYIEVKNTDESLFNIKQAKEVINNILLFTSTLTNKHIIPDAITFLWIDNDGESHIIEYYNSYFIKELSKYHKRSNNLFSLLELADNLENIAFNYGELISKNKYFFSTLYHMIGTKSIDTYDSFGTLARAIEGIHRANGINEVYPEAVVKRLKSEVICTIKEFNFTENDELEAKLHQDFKTFFVSKLSKIEEPSLKTRILKILETLSECGLTNLILTKRSKTIEQYASRAVKIRNNLTHLNGVSHLDFETQEIINYIFDFQIILHAYLLTLLGVDLSKYKDTLKNKFYI